MDRVYLIACLALVLAADAASQTVIPILQSDVFRPSLLAADTKAFFYAALPNGREVTVFMEAPAGRGAAHVVVTGSDGFRKEHTVAGMLPAPLGLFASRLAYVTASREGSLCNSLDLETGRTEVLATDVTPILLSSGGDRLAVIGRMSGTQMVMTLFGKDGGAKSTFPLESIEQQVLLRSLLSVVGQNTMLLIDKMDASYVPLHIGTQLTMGARVTLKGEEIDRSRKWPGQVQRLNRIVVLAHLRKAIGTDAFILGPYKRSEGYRLVEFNAQGQQVTARQLQIAGVGIDERVPVSFSDRMVSVVGMDRIAVMAVNGTKRTYRWE